MKKYKNVDIFNIILNDVFIIIFIITLLIISLFFIRMQDFVFVSFLIGSASFVLLILYVKRQFILEANKLEKELELICWRKKMKNKKFLVEGDFIVPFSRIVSTKNKKQAITKARDISMKKKRILREHLDINSITVDEIILKSENKYGKE